MVKLKKRFGSLSKNEKIGWLLLGVMAYFSGLIVLAFASPFIATLTS
ncbi:hypothetical protein G6L37_35050 [Agrobacterium rubi]|nr:hypothetical protein [Agrobacterium rubi]NTF23788.1 hypothetical protein [Agrobacterium rubi]